MGRKLLLQGGLLYLMSFKTFEGQREADQNSEQIKQQNHFIDITDKTAQVIRLVFFLQGQAGEGFYFFSGYIRKGYKF